MAGEKKPHDLVVSARPGHGEDYKELYHANLDTKNKGASFGEAKAACIAYIREHRAGGQGMDYRIRDRVSGAILD